MKFILFLITICYAWNCLGQSNYTWKDFKEDYLKQVPYKKEQVIDEQLLQLELIHHSPFNINDLYKYQLQQLSFLNEKQINELLCYCKYNKPIYSLNELLLLRYFDHRLRMILPLFLYCGEMPRQRYSWKEKLIKGKYLVISNFKLPLYKRKGSFKENENNNYYLGNAWGQTVRFTYDWKKRICYGLTLENDIYEPFGKNKNTPYDFTSFYFLVHTNKPFSFILGDYKVHYGQGLVLGNGFAFWKQNYVFSQHLYKNNIHPSLSTQELNFFRGGIASYNWSNISLTALLSFHKIDGTERENGSISSLKKDGYHRTLKKLKRKNNLNEKVLGLHFGYRARNCDLGLTTSWISYNKLFLPSKSVYRRYYFKGKKGFNFGAHYSFMFHHFLFSGETACDENMHLALSHILKFEQIGICQFSIAHRFYSYKYVAPLAQSLAERNKVNNEQGLLVCSDLELFKKIRLLNYIDFFYFPFPTFQASTSSKGLEFSSQVIWKPSNHWAHNAQYRFKQKEKNKSSQNILETSRECFHQFKWQTKYYFSKYLSFQGTFAHKLHKNVYNKFSKGFLIALEGNAEYKRICSSVFTAIFNTDNYVSAIYLYEPTLRYCYSLGSYYYHGIKANIIVNYHWSKKISIALKYSFTHYSNKEYISSGLQQIPANYKNDLLFQICYKF